MSNRLPVTAILAVHAILMLHSSSPTAAQLGAADSRRVAGTSTTTYIYDANGNRLSLDDGVTVETGTYDNQDRAVTYGGATYTYRQSGELLTKTDGTGTTTYDYDELGNLVSVSRPDGVVVSYVIDGVHRRVGKRINGTLVQGLVYKNDLSPIAERDGGGSLVSRFVYGTRSHVPDYMNRGGALYRLVSDQIGSVRLVVDTGTGTIAQRLDYDEFGRVLLDTNPGFQPFGFAGGIYDPDTGLVRFGARDYDPFTGRWTAKDPIRFEGGTTNLYEYVASSPLDHTDAAGLRPGGTDSGVESFVVDFKQPTFAGGKGFAGLFAGRVQFDVSASGNIVGATADLSRHGAVIQLGYVHWGYGVNIVGSLTGEYSLSLRGTGTSARATFGLGGPVEIRKLPNDHIECYRVVERDGREMFQPMRMTILPFAPLDR